MIGLLSAPHRSGGQRRYPDNALDRVLLIRFASNMGFTLSEIKLFLTGLREKSPVSPRLRRLANRKIQEVEETIRRSRRLKSLLEHLLDCRCASLQVCVGRLSLSKELRSLRPNHAGTVLDSGRGKLCCIMVPQMNAQYVHTSRSAAIGSTFVARQAGI